MEKGGIGFENGEDDTLSLSDFPAAGDGGNNLRDSGEPIGCPETEEFEFFGGGSLHPKSEDDHMCVADEVFFQGQILPMDRSCSSRTSVGFDSSGSMSRSHSTDSSRSESSRRPASSGSFYARPSRRPQLPARKQGFVAVVVGRRSASAPMTGILRFGLVRVPEYDLGHLGHRKIGASQGGGKVEPQKKTQKNGCGFLRNRFGCRYSAGDVLEPISCCAGTRESVDCGRRKEEEALLSRRRRRRTCQWLEELSATKGHDSWVTSAAAEHHRR